MMLRPVPKPRAKRRVPKRVDRGKFSKKTIQKIRDRDNGQCQMCMGKGTEIHHVMPKGRSGRGIETNALTLCSQCHAKVHSNNEILNYWIDVFADRYGGAFFQDEYDKSR